MYYLLTPVTTPPKKEGWYYISHKYSWAAEYIHGKWIASDDYGETVEIFPTHYLAPVEAPLCVTVEQLRAMADEMWGAGADEVSGKDFDQLFTDYLKQHFGI